MGFLDRLFGTEPAEQAGTAQRTQTLPRQAAPRSEDDVAVERYRYLLRTAPPETIEQVHREAFAKLTDAQRAIIYEELSKGAGTGERPLSSEPATLARAATRAELRQPGTMERAFGGTATDATGAQRSGPSFGAMVGSSLLGTVAGYVIGSALVSAFLPWDGGVSGAGDANADAGSDAGADASAADASASDFGGGDFSGGDFGGDFGF